MAQPIDKEALIANYKSMINVLEYDSMRSPGKAKMNSQHLHSMHFLVELYEAAQAVKKKPTTKVGT